MSQMQQGIHHFPGHMKKALERLSPYVKSADFLVEITDARAPESSRNPLFSLLAGNKPRLLLLSKEDRADPNITAKWLSFYKKQGTLCFSSNLVQKGKLNAILERESAPLLSKKREKEARFGMKKQDARILVFGVPNVGKSTFINALAGRSKVKSENRPGVTRAEQWIRLKGGITLLDTPGILPMRYENHEDAVRLALLGALPDVILPTHELYLALCHFLQEKYPFALKDRYEIDNVREFTLEDILVKVATNRGYLGKGANIQKEETEKLLLREFRDGILGRFSLEEPYAEL